MGENLSKYIEELAVTGEHVDLKKLFGKFRDSSVYRLWIVIQSEKRKSTINFCVYNVAAIQLIQVVEGSGIRYFFLYARLVPDLDPVKVRLDPKPCKYHFFMSILLSFISANMSVYVHLFINKFLANTLAN